MRSQHGVQVKVIHFYVQNWVFVLARTVGDRRPVFNYNQRNVVVPMKPPVWREEALKKEVRFADASYRLGCDGLESQDRFFVCGVQKHLPHDIAGINRVIAPCQIPPYECATITYCGDVIFDLRPGILSSSAAHIA